MTKIIISLACLLLVVASASVECRPKRSVVLTAPVIATAGVPVVRTDAVVHSNPTTVVKTEQVHSGTGASYSYSTETKSVPVVHHHTATVAAAVPAAVATVAHVPAATYAYYPAAAASYYSPYYYSPYHYVVGK